MIEARGHELHVTVVGEVANVDLERPRLAVDDDDAITRRNDPLRDEVAGKDAREDPLCALVATIRSAATVAIARTL